MKVKIAFAWLAFSLLSCWGVMAIVYSGLPAGARLAGAAAFIVAALAGALLPKKGWWKIACFTPAFLAVLAWWLALPPGNSREWEPDVARLPYADVYVSSVTLHNIRNCDYLSEREYTVRHYDRVYDLGALKSLDLFFVDWGLPNIAHTMLSFGFGGDNYVVFSIETRREKGEEYSSVRGFFKQYELTYVVADERDVVRLRTNYRKGEDVYLYRLTASPEFIRKVFLDYLGSVNGLKARPRWYNALTANCTTDIWKHIAPFYPGAKFDWRILASGHVDEMAYELGVLDQTFPFRELKRRSVVNERGRAAGGRDFPGAIRRGLPGFDRSPQ
ncbi:MAG: hypothetical protein A2X31_04550 [Elusimicrobia bacterium GWB2_63_22]|nr:MAG: hypothetical protein A2X31_04550 [Elusimicrobia bacterium GWB2_63_22]